MESLIPSVLLTALLSLSAPTEPIKIYHLPAIAGLWQVDVINDQDMSSCPERYNFGSNGKIITTSGAEKTTGVYEFRYLDESSLPALAMTTTFDNNQKDCSGTNIDQTNHSFAVFVKLDSRHNPTKMQWCSDKDGLECQASFHRILP